MQNLTKSRLTTMRKIAQYGMMNGEAFTAKNIGSHGASLQSLQKIGIVDLAPMNIIPDRYWVDTQGQWWHVTEEGRKAFAAFLRELPEPIRNR